MLNLSTPSYADSSRPVGPGTREPAAPRRILLVDDHALVRMSVVNLCAQVSRDLQVIEATNMATAMRLYEANEESIELVLLDLNLPDSKGFAALQMLKRRFPRCRVVVLSGASDDAVAAEACVLGADKFLHKGVDPAQFTATLNELMEPMALSRRVRETAPPTPQRRSSSQPVAHSLSSREIEILNLVLQGKTNQEIVVATNLKLGTVKNYISGLFVVFGVPSRSKLVSLFV